MSNIIDIGQQPKPEWEAVDVKWFSCMLPGFIRGYQICVVLFYNNHFGYYSAYIGVPSNYFSSLKDAIAETAEEQMENVQDHGSKLFFDEAYGFFGKNEHAIVRTTGTSFTAQNFRR